MVELLFLLRTWSQISVLVLPDLHMMKFLGEGDDNFLKLSSAMSDKDFLEETRDDSEFRSSASSQDNYACVSAAIFH